MSSAILQTIATTGPECIAPPFEPDPSNWFLSSFIPTSEIADYMKACWAIDINFTESVNQAFAPPIEAIGFLNDFVLKSLLPEIIGFSIFVTVFGISLPASLLSLHYLVKKWRMNLSHLIITAFTLIILALNIAVFGMKIATIFLEVQAAVCPVAVASLPGALLNDVTFQFFPENWPWRSFGDQVYSIQTVSVALSLSVIPVFLWVSDAFLLYRAWVIWTNRRAFTVVPALTFLASVVSGIVWIVNAAKHFRGVNITTLLDPLTPLSNAVASWIPALGFSCGLDTLTTGMIAGRLIFYHRKQRKATESRSTFYLPVIAIFIESAALSLLSKTLQLSLHELAFMTRNPVVVPLCTISSNLIVLRQALGIDINRSLSQGRHEHDLSNVRFRRRSMVSTSRDAPGRFESYLIQSIGGRAVDSSVVSATQTLVVKTEVQDGREVQVHGVPPDSERSDSRVQD